MINEVFSIINLFKLISFCKHANAFIFFIVLQKQAMSKPVILMNYTHTVVHFSHYSMILLTALHTAVKSRVQVDVLHCVAAAYFHFSVCVLTILVFLSKTPTRMRSSRLPLHSLCLCLYGPLFFFCLSASYCFRYFLTCQTFSADTGLQFSVIPLSTMLPVFTINYTCFLNMFVKHLFTEV